MMTTHTPTTARYGAQSPRSVEFVSSIDADAAWIGGVAGSTGDHSNTRFELPTAA